MATLENRGAYGGPERRRHRVFLTHHSEYHCRDEICVAVRDLATGQFREDHTAIGRRMTGGIEFTNDGGVASCSAAGEEPQPGQSLFFSDGSLELRTSALRSIERPPKAVVEQYRASAAT